MARSVRPPSVAALRERNARMAPIAQELFEAALGAGESVECPSCGEQVPVPGLDKTKLDIAKFVLSSAGVGPVARVKDEDKLPTDPRELLTITRDMLAELSESERSELLLEFVPQRQIGDGA